MTTKQTGVQLLHDFNSRKESSASKLWLMVHHVKVLYRCVCVCVCACVRVCVCVCVWHAWRNRSVGFGVKGNKVSHPEVGQHKHHRQCLHWFVCLWFDSLVSGLREEEEDSKTLWTCRGGKERE